MSSVVVFLFRGDLLMVDAESDVVDELDAVRKLELRQLELRLVERLELDTVEQGIDLGGSSAADGLSLIHI